MSKDERDKQDIGRGGHEVFMCGSSVVMATSKGQIEYTYTADEALALLAWLYLHREELYKVALVDEAQAAHRFVCSTARPFALR